jgi:hypothetical protein
MAAITATSTSNTDSSVSPDVRPFPAPYLIPAGTTTSADFCPVSPRLAAEAVGAATRQHNRHPGRPPRIRTTTFPLRPPRLRDDPAGDDGLYLLEQAHPDRPRLLRGSCSPVQGFASGFLPTPPHDDAVASGSELASPLPPGDFHPQAIAHAGRTQGGACGAAGPASAAGRLCLGGPPTARQATCAGWRGSARLIRPYSPAERQCASSEVAVSRPRHDPEYRRNDVVSECWR